MSEPVFIQIIGAPIACSEGFKDAWRETAEWLAGNLKGWYGKAVWVQYYDLFEPDCPPLPPDSQLPVVLVNGDLLSSGQKLSVPAVRRHLDELGVRPEMDRA
jgi:hypothetical protein